MQSEESGSSPLKYKRVLLKLSGEALMGPGQFGIDIPTCEKFAKAIKGARDAGAEICLVIGGGNIFRGVAGAAKGMERAQADSMGIDSLSSTRLYLSLLVSGSPLGIVIFPSLEALWPPKRFPAACHGRPGCSKPLAGGKASLIRRLLSWKRLHLRSCPLPSRCHHRA